MIRLPRLPDPVLRIMLDVGTEADETNDSVIEARYFEPTFADLWREHRQVLLRAYTEEHPGRRPSRWWRLDAPRQPVGRWAGAFWDGTLEEPRPRLGGIGTPAWEALAYAPSYHLGLPSMWVTARDVELYTGRARDIHGKPIMPEFAERAEPFRGVAPDPENPPVFESQASYLQRLGLLLPGELRRLRSQDFDPVKLVEDHEV